MLTVQQWHARFKQQSIWTDQIRHYLYQQSGLSSANHVLEIGCGSGVITTDLRRNCTGQVLGVDLRLDFLQFASNNKTISWIQADGFVLPFYRIFDITFCHYFLLWVNHPETILMEMRRVTQLGGYIVALAEPDYGGRIDHPPELVHLGFMQTSALLQQGADPFIGRKLNELFHQTGLVQVQIGLLGGSWKSSPRPHDRETEWAILESDLADQLDSETLKELNRVDIESWKNGSRTLFVPTFYAIGQVPEIDPSRSGA